MRTRERHHPPDVASTSIWWHDTAPNPDVHTHYGDPVYCWIPSGEVITDDPKRRWMVYRKGVKRAVFKSVLHEKYVLYAHTQPIAVPATSTGYWTSSGAHRVLQQLWMESEATGAALLAHLRGKVLAKSPTPDHGHYDRWQATRPSMSSRLNLAVSLLELRDIKKMWDILPPKHFSFGKEGWPGVLARWANGQHLNFNFGWKPFCSDVYNVFDQAANFGKRLSKILREADRPLMKRFRDSPTLVQETWSETTGRYSGESTHYRLDGVSKHVSNFHYSYVLPKYSEKELRWRAMADALGLNPSIATAYQVLPWSFVLDWFYNLGKLLESQVDDWLAPAVTFLQSGYSQHLTGRLDVGATCLTTGGTSTYQGFSLMFDYYYRYVGLPHFDGSTPPLDADKIRLGASLLYGLTK